MSSTNIYHFYIYAYIRENGSVYYIGKGKDKRAWAKHQNAPTPNDHSKIIIMESNLSELGAFALERFYIKWYGRKDNNTGILRNLTDGGEGSSGTKPSMETISKRAKSNTGLKRSSEICLKMSLSRKNIKASVESRLRMSMSQIGKKHSNETKQKMSIKKSHTWSVTDPNGNTHNIINLLQFCKDNQLNKGHMISVAHGRSKSHKGYTCSKLI